MNMVLDILSNTKEIQKIHRDVTAPVEEKSYLQYLVELRDRRAHARPTIRAIAWRTTASGTSLLTCV